MTLVPNRPTPEGWELGKPFGRMMDRADAELRAKFPDMEERCKSCAYRPGTIPNGCPETIMDAIKCAVEVNEFYCHEVFDKDGKPTKICAGWMLAVSTSSVHPIVKKMKTPWPYSHEASSND